MARARRGKTVAAIARSLRKEPGGLLGTATFQIAMPPFAPFLRLGEVVHVGKGTSFGLGKYCIPNGQREGQA